MCACPLCIHVNAYTYTYMYIVLVYKWMRVVKIKELDGVVLSMGYKGTVTYTSAYMYMGG